MSASDSLTDDVTAPGVSDVGADSPSDPGQGSADAPPVDDGPNADAGADVADPTLGTYAGVTPSVLAPVGDAIVPEQGDWLDRICPYLLSEDGTYRSTQPDEGHRCTAQDPPESLPMAFQERFCLTDRHDRCEMFKYAQAARAAALEEGGVPTEQVQGARFKPSVRSVPLALGPSGEDADSARSRRNVVLIAAGFGAAVLFILVVILLSGGGGNEGTVPGPSGSPDPAATTAAAAVSTPRPTPATSPGAIATSAAAATPAAGGEDQLIQYEVQEGEALMAIAETFGTTRRRIIRSNEGMAEKTPYTQTGDIILVPVAAAMTVEELEAFPGYLGPAE